MLQNDKVLLRDAQRFVLEYARLMRSITDLYITSAPQAFRLAQKEKHNILQALNLPDLYYRLSEDCCKPLVDILMHLLHLPVVNIYDPSSVIVIFTGLREFFFTKQHKAGMTACLVLMSSFEWVTKDTVHSILRHQHLSSMYGRAAASLKELSSDQSYQAVNIMGRRLLRRIVRKHYDLKGKRDHLKESLKDLEEASQLLASALDDVKSTSWFKIEQLLVNIELCSTLYELVVEEKGAEEWDHRANVTMENLTRLADQLFMGEGKATFHPLRALCLEKKGCLLEVLGEHDSALGVHKAALDIRKRIFGKRHPEVTVSLSQIGISYMNMEGSGDEAENALLEALQVFKDTLGSDHERVANVQGNLGKLFQKRGDYHKAEAAIRDYEYCPLSEKVKKLLSELDHMLAQRKMEAAGGSSAGLSGGQAS
ncbi:hypothetical protein Vretimale_12139 [Volvox reticuliferus]|nr:hypothetical protein Vretifemale_9603 [Volvox reticuliferus]GIM08050.1 hypothetical protein Vretimale_12139 [Volvox reticuliferus]